MKVLSISSDRNIFKEGSAVRARMVQYGTLFEEMHVVVFSTRAGNKKTQIAKNVWVYPTNSWTRWLYIFDAIRIGRSIVKGQLSKAKDWVLTAQDPFECGLVAEKLARWFNLPLHIQIHTDFLNPYFATSSFLNRIRVRIAKKVLSRANAIRVVSQRIKGSLLQTKNYQLRTVPTVLPIFTDLEKFKTTEPSFSLQEKYAPWGFIILIVARLSREKNISFSLDVLRELLKKYPKIGLVIVGEGPERENLELRIKNYELGENVVFEGWQEDLVSYYKTANLFLQTSLYEGFGLSLLEAVASGCPAVSSDVGIAPELLTHKGHSFVCPVNDLSCFVSKISELIENNQLRTFVSTQIDPDAAWQFTQAKEGYLKAYKESIESALSQA